MPAGVFNGSPSTSMRAAPVHEKPWPVLVPTTL